MTDVEELELRNHGWEQALLTRDVDGVAEYLHEDYALVIVHPSPATVPRAEWLQTLPSYVIHRWEPVSAIVDVNGDAAVIHHRVDMHATVFGQDRSGPFVLTDCWLRGEDRAWRVWRRYSTPLSAGDIPRG